MVCPPLDIHPHVAAHLERYNQRAFKIAEHAVLGPMVLAEDHNTAFQRVHAQVPAREPTASTTEWFGAWTSPARSPVLVVALAADAPHGSRSEIEIDPDTNIKLFQEFCQDFDLHFVDFCNQIAEFSEWRNLDVGEARNPVNLDEIRSLFEVTQVVITDKYLEVTVSRREGLLPPYAEFFYWEDEGITSGDVELL